MAKIKYQYNPDTCKYEPLYATGKSIARRTIVFLAVAFTLALGGFIYYDQNYESLDEQLLQQENETLRTEWSIVQHRIENASHELAGLVDKDDHNYRVILDTDPLPTSVREAGIGGNEKLTVAEIKEFPILLSNYQHLEKLKHQLDVEVQSYEELSKMLDEKIKMWASRPAIQPINNKHLQQLHLTYGSRYHPIFHVWKEHKGLDFAAAEGTPVYATGDGVVSTTYFSETYGNVSYVNHGHNIETRYAHLSKFAALPGQHVKRGQVIAYVGSTGNSVSSHLHYEILFNGQHVNPINFFQRDLSNKEYDKLIEIGSKVAEPLD